MNNLSLPTRVRYFFATVNWKLLSFKIGKCPVCGFKFFLKLNDHGFGIRCLWCGSSNNTFSLVEVIKTKIPSLANQDIQIVSAGGPFYNWLTRQNGIIHQSQYFEHTLPGQRKLNIRCEDLQKLTYNDETFDLLTNSEVLEHVPDDLAAFREIHRVLKPGGYFIFTVPLNLQRKKTITRAKLTMKGVNHLEQPEYHDDPIRGSILAYRNYGSDIINKLEISGFSDISIETPVDPSGYGKVSPVIVAQKPQKS
jgi:SAM-dependent methyltransferase